MELMNNKWVWAAVAAVALIFAASQGLIPDGFDWTVIIPK